MEQGRVTRLDVSLEQSLASKYLLKKLRSNDQCKDGKSSMHVFKATRGARLISPLGCHQRYRRARLIFSTPIGSSSQHVPHYSSLLLLCRWQPMSLRALTMFSTHRYTLLKTSTPLDQFTVIFANLSIAGCISTEWQPLCSKEPCFPDLVFVLRAMPLRPEPGQQARGHRPAAWLPWLTSGYPISGTSRT